MEHQGICTFAFASTEGLMPDYRFSLSSKLPRTGITIFTRMSNLAREKNAINLSQGFPGFDVPDALKNHVADAMRNGLNQYAPMQGVLALREAVVDLRHKLNGVHYDANEEVVITAGATQAIFTAILALIREDDEVVIFTPAYDCYAPAVELAGGKPIYVKLKAPDYHIDWAEVRKVVNRKTRMILINTPHNPTGAILSENDLHELDHLTEGSDTIVLSDEVYEYMVFDGNKHHSPASHVKLADRTLCVGSFGKTFHATGWKTGYIVGPAQLMAEFRKVHQYNVFATNAPMQHGLAAFIREAPEHIKGLSDFYRQKRDRFLAGIEGSRFKFTPTPGTYFQLLNYSAIDKGDDLTLAERLTAHPGVASIPVSVFYHQPENNKVLRFCFAKTDEELDEATRRLKTL
ncbi:MAG: methionine aminotransferase [Flavobacteriales bacterium]